MAEKLILNRQQSTAVDRIAIQQYGIPGVVLMENAGRNCAAEISSSLFQEPAKQDCQILIGCGAGNNGGDGFVIARHLAIEGYSVKVFVFAERARILGDAKINLDILEKTTVPVEWFDEQWTENEIRQRFETFDGAPTTCFVDCWLGTGAMGAPRSPINNAIRIANELNVQRVAIDIPSGLDCDTGQPYEPTFKADVTLTLVTEKSGFQSPCAKGFIGKVKVVGIGIPDSIVQQASEID